MQGEGKHEHSLMLHGELNEIHLINHETQTTATTIANNNQTSNTRSHFTIRVCHFGSRVTEGLCFFPPYAALAHDQFLSGILLAQS